MLTKTQQKQSQAALESAITLAGGPTQLAELLGLSRMAVNLWRRGERLISIDQAYRIQKLLKGKVRGADLRPDTKNLFK